MFTSKVLLNYRNLADLSAVVYGEIKAKIATLPIFRGYNPPLGDPTTVLIFQRNAQDGNLRDPIRDWLFRECGLGPPVRRSLSQHPDQVNKHQHVGNQQSHTHPCQSSHQFVYLDGQE